MAMHEIPVDGVEHMPALVCPCQPRPVKRGAQPRRIVYVHNVQPAPAPAGSADQREGGGGQ